MRLLFCELTQPQWASEYDWFQWRAFARDLEPDHPSLMRDANADLLVAPSSNPMICKFRSDYPQIHLAFVKTIRVRQIAVRMGKGGKDRVVPLSEKLMPKLAKHLEKIKSIRQEDLKGGFGEALLPPTLARKLNGAEKDWAWQFAFLGPLQR